MMVKRRIVAQVLLVLFLYSVPAVKAAGPLVEWRRDYVAARKEARRTHRPMVVDVCTPGCVWCQKLENTTFQDEGVAGVVNQKFIPMKVDAQQHASLAQGLGVQSFPTLVLATPDGKIIEVVEGYVDADTLSGHLKRALEHTRQAAAEEDD